MKDRDVNMADIILLVIINEMKRRIEFMIA